MLWLSCSTGLGDVAGAGSGARADSVNDASALKGVEEDDPRTVDRGADFADGDDPPRLSIGAPCGFTRYVYFECITNAGSVFDKVRCYGTRRRT